ncbi:hypothetical protein [Litorilituus lipolyticus]|uniref:hypothetical protein n=1 Tax=Litorilituus lipolyticus TaxID=2491017 RepID=UPI0014797CAA|nr:hypothetical protein [Litorilituus lipolyticus]
MVKLISLNVFFAAILLMFIVMPVKSNWLWLALIFTWCWGEGLVAQQASVKWWHMLLLFIVLGALEFYLVSIFQH